MTAGTDRERGRYRRGAAPMALLLCLLGSGCAGTWPWRESASVLPRHADRDAVAALDNWVLNGRVGIQHHDQGVSADLQWRQAGQRFELRIGAPLNGGTFVLEGGADGVTLLRPDGSGDSATDVESLMRRNLEWSLPVTGAAWWVRGLPHPRSAATQPQFDAAGRYTDFAQDGWRISVLDYWDDRVPVLPRKLYLARDTLSVRMLIKTWSVHAQ